MIIAKNIASAVQVLMSRNVKEGGVRTKILEVLLSDKSLIFKLNRLRDGWGGMGNYFAVLNDARDIQDIFSAFVVAFPNDIIITTQSLVLDLLPFHPLFCEGDGGGETFSQGCLLGYFKSIHLLKENESPVECITITLGKFHEIFQKIAPHFTRETNDSASFWGELSNEVSLAVKKLTRQEIVYFLGLIDILESGKSVKSQASPVLDRLIHDLYFKFFGKLTKSDQKRALYTAFSEKFTEAVG